MIVREIDPDKVVIKNRQRSELGSLESLKDSIKKFGQLHPITVRKDGDDLVLVSGERRLRACQQLNIPVKYVLRSELTELEALILELRENTDRKELSPAERALAIKDAHERLCKFHAKRPKPWTQSDTAKELGLSDASVSDALSIAEEVNILSNTGLDPTKMTQTALRAAARRTSKVQRLLKDVEKAVVNTAGVDVLLDRVKMICGDIFDENLQLPFGEFDLVLTDPPWKIDYKKQSFSRTIGKQFDTHYEDDIIDVQREAQMFHIFYRLLNKDGILLTFCSVQSFASWMLFAKSAGFERIYTAPIIWIKGDVGTQPNPELYPGNAAEFILLAHKGCDSRLQIAGRPNHFTAKPLSIEERIHPSEKPEAVFMWLLELACPIGGSMIDPFMGSGASLRAAFDYGCSKIYGVDINKNTVDLAWAKMVSKIEGGGEDELPT